MTKIGTKKTRTRFKGILREDKLSKNCLINTVNLNKQYLEIGNRTDFIGGLGTCIDYEHSRYLKDKDGNLLDPNAQKLFRRLKKSYTKVFTHKGSRDRIPNL